MSGAILKPTLPTSQRETRWWPTRTHPIDKRRRHVEVKTKRSASACPDCSSGRMVDVKESFGSALTHECKACGARYALRECDLHD